MQNDGTNGSPPNPLENLHLSLDPLTVDAAAGKRRLKTVEADGSLTYDDAKTPDAKLTEQLERIWNEYPDGLLDITEDKLVAHPDRVVESEKKELVKDEERPHDRSEIMPWDEMEKLRSEIYMSLNDARNEFWFALELAKTLSESSTFTIQPPHESAQPGYKKMKKQQKTVEPVVAATTSLSTTVEPPILPQGTFSATVCFPAERRPREVTHELELALAAKQRAIEDCSALIDAAVAELQSMSDAGGRFWRNVRDLKEGERGRGQWAVVPKPDFGRTMAEGEGAKDIIIPYAVDEASPAVRARSLAAFDLDPTKEDSLTFGARTHFRLRVIHSTVSGTFCSSPALTTDDVQNVRALMEAAQMEAFDEDLWEELRAEASRLGSSYAVEPRSIVADLGNGDGLTFQMVDIREPTSTPTPSPLCDLLLSSIRLGLLHLQQQRKKRLVASTSSPLPQILLPAIQMLGFQTLCKQVFSTLEMVALAIESAGMEARIIKRMSLRDESADLERMLAGQAGLDILGGVITLAIEGWWVLD
ncbi:hypothetical protein P7C73_g3572, partial [Tremellales sp. Uapishka_1]